MEKSCLKFEKFRMKPGVYQFIGEKGEILYVGKAKNLRNRIRQYFLKNIDRGPGILQMIEKAVEINTIETDSEIEAILLEAELINKIKPKYNIRAKDDKSFLTIKIAKKSNGTIQTSNVKQNDKCQMTNVFPTVELIRAKNVDFGDKGSEYFGPYPSGDSLKKAMRYLRRIFQFRDCSNIKFTRQAKCGRPCIYGEIRVCSAPCVNRVSKSEYDKNIKQLKLFLQNKRGKLVTSLDKEMAALSRKKQYEDAALVRDKIKALEHLRDVSVGISDDLQDSSMLLFKRIECYDISNNQGKNVVGSMVVFGNGKPDKQSYRLFGIMNNELRIMDKTENENAISETKIHKSKLIIQSTQGDIYWMKEVLVRRFKNDWPLPNLIIVDGGQLQLNIAKEVLRSMKLDIPVLAIAKGKERKKNDFRFSDEKFANYFRQSEYLKSVSIQARDEAHRFAINYYRKLHIEDLLKD